MQIFPALFDWVAYPVTLLIRRLYENEMTLIQMDEAPCQYRVELIASLERVLCFCHTGNTAALATSLMNPLGLSRGVVKDGFPTLHRIFVQSTICSAMTHGFMIDKREWPNKDGHPAIASRRAQTLTYSLDQFMVSLLSRPCLYLPFPFPPRIWPPCIQGISIRFSHRTPSTSFFHPLPWPLSPFSYSNLDVSSLVSHRPRPHGTLTQIVPRHP